MPRDRKPASLYRQMYDKARTGLKDACRVELICPLLSGPKSMLFWIMKEIGNAIEEAQAGGDHRQVA